MCRTGATFSSLSYRATFGSASQPDVEGRDGDEALPACASPDSALFPACPHAQKHIYIRANIKTGRNAVTDRGNG